MMDPLTASTTFATIVGLLCNYAAERRVEPQDRFNDFMESLRDNHENVRSSIESNAELTRALHTLLSQQADVVTEKLANLDAVLAGVAANLEDFRPVCMALKSEEVISEEAVEILTRLYDSGDGRFIELTQFGSGGVTLLPLDTGAEAIDLEHRFLRADLNTLCGLGFLDPTHNSKGERIYILTRQAERYIKAIRQAGDNVSGS